MADARPKVIVLAGPNGAGKSTLAPFLIRDTYGLTEYVNADTIASGLAAFSPESVATEAGRIMLRRLHALAGARASFAFETTLASRAYAVWLAELRRQGYEFHLVYLWLRSAELAVERVRQRTRLGGHDVAPEVVRRRYLKSVRNYFQLYRPLADSWGIYDNSSAGQVHCIAAGQRDITTELFDERTWQQFCEVVK